MNEILSQYGLPGLIIGGLAWYVLMIEKRHREERRENTDRLEKLNDETNKNIRENTSVLSSLKTMLENRK